MAEYLSVARRGTVGTRSLAFGFNRRFLLYNSVKGEPVLCFLFF